MIEQDLTADTAPEAPVRTAAQTEDPWHGIPAELLDATRGYDTDSAGGCG